MIKAAQIIIHIHHGIRQLGGLVGLYKNCMAMSGTTQFHSGGENKKRGRSLLSLTAGLEVQLLRGHLCDHHLGGLRALQLFPKEAA